MEGFFKRLEKYIEVRPTAALKDVVVKIMVEVLEILGIVTKEIRQGKLSMCFRVDDICKSRPSEQRSFSRSWPGSRVSRMHFSGWIN
jgi:nucleoside-triphosphatase THEP1